MPRERSSPEDPASTAGNFPVRGLRRLSAPVYQNVVLVGFMGSGKSSVGRLVARTLEGRFVDTDRLVVDREKREINDIFAQQGERFFRQLESSALRSLLGRSGLAIATGGGIVTVPRNGPMLKKLGLVVWLTAHEDVLWERVSRNKKRPLLLTDNPRETVRSLLEARNPMYEAAAEMTVDTTDLTHAEVAAKICDRVRAGRKAGFAGGR
jgi:shikimate kinase